jgi:hypothetical protein
LLARDAGVQRVGIPRCDHVVKNLPDRILIGGAGEADRKSRHMEL